MANYDSVENGDLIIETAIKAFGRIDILINNAGILRDVSFKNMTDADWDLIIKVHVKGAYKCARAAWPHFRKQKYGRVINTASAAGLFGSFGQCNYSGKLTDVRTMTAANVCSCQIVPSRVYGDACKGRLQIQHHLQCHCSHRGKQND